MGLACCSPAPALAPVLLLRSRYGSFHACTGKSSPIGRHPSHRLRSTPSDTFRPFTCAIELVDRRARFPSYRRESLLHHQSYHHCQRGCRLSQACRCLLELVCYPYLPCWVCRPPGSVHGLPARLGLSSASLGSLSAVRQAGSAVCWAGSAVCQAGSAVCHALSTVCLSGSAVCQAGSAVCHARSAVCHARPAIHQTRSAVCHAQSAVHQAGSAVCLAGSAVCQAGSVLHWHMAMVMSTCTCVRVLYH